MDPQTATSPLTQSSRARARRTGPGRRARRPSARDATARPRATARRGPRPPRAGRRRRSRWARSPPASDPTIWWWRLLTASSPPPVACASSVPSATCTGCRSSAKRAPASWPSTCSTRSPPMSTFASCSPRQTPSTGSPAAARRGEQRELVLVAAAVHPGAVGHGRAAVRGRVDVLTAREHESVEPAQLDLPHARPARPAAGPARRRRRSRSRRQRVRAGVRVGRPVHGLHGTRDGGDPDQRRHAGSVPASPRRRYRADMAPGEPRTPPPARNAISRRWEALPGPAQFLVAFLIWFVALLGRARHAAQPADVPRLPVRDLLGRRRSRS